MTPRRSAVLLGMLAGLEAAVIVAPSIVLARTAEKGGVPGLDGLDLVVGSAALGFLHATLLARRLWRQRRAGRRTSDLVIATLDATVVLALASTVLVVGVLGGFAPQHGVLVNRGWPVLALWLGVLGVAVGLAELTRRWLLRWLGADPRPPSPATATASAGRVGPSPERAGAVGQHN